MMRKWIFFFCIMTTNVFANICLNINLPENDIYNFRDEIKIKSFDGINIAANLFTPKYLNTKLPTVIFVNSWTLEEHEYTKQAIEFVKKGYQVLSYSTRGWGCSDGYVDVIGPKDIEDLKSVVDWLYDNTNIDKERLGIAGISYGGGMTLMALAKEPRIKTGFAMSAWASLYEAMYHQETPRLFWSSVLMATGFLLGRIDDTLKENFKKLLKSDDKAEIKKWADERSAMSFIDEINKRNVPVYISNNFGDNLFQPNNVIRFYNKLTTPKILDLNQGTHATGELTGLFTVSNYTFKRLHAWFDYWLKNKTQKSSLVLNRINVETDLKHERDIMNSDISPDHKKNKKFYLWPRNKSNDGLVLEKYIEKEKVDTIYSGRDTFASTGIPLLSALVDGHFRIPVYSYMPLINPDYGVKFITEELKDDLKIRGIPELTVNIDSHEMPFQIVTYLYDINKFGAAKLITHGVLSGEKINGLKSMEIVATAYNVPKGHKLALVIDTKDLLYAPKSRDDFKLDFIFKAKSPSVLEVPIR